ncbi:MAG: hypothetical protein QOE61_2083 [Micromonosporaceae bacterium]|jgi:hypothetical protein|nr:hypothetical protein [Micromonosporaceae bacterium]
MLMLSSFVSTDAGVVVWKPGVERQVAWVVTWVVVHGVSGDGADEGAVTVTVVGHPRLALGGLIA